MGRLEELRAVDPVLTNLARGYTNEELVGTQLFPIAYVNKESGKIPQFSKEAFKLYKTERAIRASTNKLLPEGISTIDFALTEHDLAYPIDYREEDEATVVDLEAYAVQTVQDIILLRLEKEIADIAQDLTNYPTGQKLTLAGTDQWTDYTNSDPITHVRDAVETVRKAIGRRPNVLLLGNDSYRALQDHPKILDRIKYSQKAIVTPDILAVIFDIPRVIVGRAIYVDDAGNTNSVWNDVAIVAYVPPQPNAVQRTPYTPAFGYTLRKRGYPEVDKFDEQGGKVRYVRVTDIVGPKMVGADAGYIINDTCA